MFARDKSKNAEIQLAFRVYPKLIRDYQSGCCSYDYEMQQERVKYLI